MSYTPTIWQDGDVIIAEKLNHAESGIGDGGLPKSTVESPITAGSAMVFDGESWTEQSGYGYVQRSSYGTLTWDFSDTTDRDSFNFSTANAYKISDAILTVDDLTGAEVIISAGGQTNYFTASANDIAEGTNVVLLSKMDVGVVVFCISDENFEIMGASLVAPSTGVYVLQAAQSGTISIKLDKTFQFTKELIPDNVISLSNIHATDNPWICKVTDDEMDVILSYYLNKKPLLIALNDGGTGIGYCYPASMMVGSATEDPTKPIVFALGIYGTVSNPAVQIIEICRLSDYPDSEG